MASGIKNGNQKSPDELPDNVLRIVVIGEPQCGKTTFIRACVRDNMPGQETSTNGVSVYPCKFEIKGKQRTLALYEIPGQPDLSIEQRLPYYHLADIFVFMYAIDDPSSLEKLTSKWLPETSGIVYKKIFPVFFVGNKNDLRNNPQVIERLELNNQVPVPSRVAEGKWIMQLSSNDVDAVSEAFRRICNSTFDFESLLD